MNLSASQISKFRRCQRIIGFDYVEGIKEPSSPKQKFGTAVHAELERWLKDATPPSDTPEGNVAKQGIQKGWLPTPSKKLKTELYIKTKWARNVQMVGFIDCFEPPDLIIDHKTTSSLNWVKTPEQLAADEQAIIYATWAILTQKIPAVRLRWIYYSASNPETGPRKPNGARPVEVRLDSRDPLFLEHLRGLEKDAREVVRIRRQGIKGLELPFNPESCSMYNGCFYRNLCNIEPGDFLEALIKKGK
jgi:hypothetical protein